MFLSVVESFNYRPEQVFMRISVYQKKMYFAVCKIDNFVSKVKVSMCVKVACFCSTVQPRTGLQTQQVPALESLM